MEAGVIQNSTNARKRWQVNLDSSLCNFLPVKIKIQVMMTIIAHKSFFTPYTSEMKQMVLITVITDLFQVYIIYNLYIYFLQILLQQNTKDKQINIKIQY